MNDRLPILDHSKLQRELVAHDRLSEIRNLLEKEKCFKMICGAGNEDAAMVKKLALIYTLAGAKILDVSANLLVIKAAVVGIDEAFRMSKKFKIPLKIRPYIMVSVGMPGDHHVRKSYIDPYKCISCDLCAPVCPTKAIPYDFVQRLRFFKDANGSFEEEDQNKEIVIRDLCIGCGKCSNICPKSDIISYRHNEAALRDLLPKCLKAGAEMFELHAAVDDDEITMREWKIINEINSYNLNFMCLDRLNLGNLNLEERIENVKKMSNNRFAIQADGYPMSGGENDFNTTLQAIACADVINKKFNMRKTKDGRKKYRPHGHRKNVYIVLSGGTNQFTKDLADSTGVRCNGVAIGTYARKIVEKYVENKNFWNDKKEIYQAYMEAKKLVNSNIGEMNE